LYNNHEESLKNDNIDAYINQYSGFVQQLTDETFLQISNASFGIQLTNPTVFLINCRGDILQNISSTFSFANLSNGQIAFQFGNIGTEFFELVRLKIVDGSNIYFSNSFTVNNNLKEETSRIEYRNNFRFHGIAYDLIPFYQTIRLQLFKNDIDATVESESYTQLTGSIISLRSIITRIDKYVMYISDAFTFNRLVILLNHDIIFINNYKISNKPTLSKRERQEGSNIFDLNFDANPTDFYKDFQMNQMIKYNLDHYNLEHYA
jgi:hypothetical protein